jgi:hypothetical protein
MSRTTMFLALLSSPTRAQRKARSTADGRWVVVTGDDSRVVSVSKGPPGGWEFADAAVGIRTDLGRKTPQTSFRFARTGWFAALSVVVHVYSLSSFHARRAQENPENREGIRDEGCEWTG